MDLQSGAEALSVSISKMDLIIVFIINQRLTDRFARERINFLNSGVLCLFVFRFHLNVVNI